MQYSKLTAVTYLIFGCALVGLVGWNLHLRKDIHDQIQKIKADDGANGRHKRSNSQQGQATTGGATYIRWGRSTCPDDDSDLVYAGVAGGSHYAHSSGGAEYLCLTRDVQYAKGTKAVDASYHAEIYGVEFEVTTAQGSYTNVHGLFSSKNSAPSPLHDSDVICAVCKSKRRSAKVMIPGRKECYPGWKKEYWGFLMTEAMHDTHKGWHSYACVDEAPEVQDHSARNDNGALMYHVQGICGSLPCAHYVNKFPLTCVVCTQ